MLGALIRDIVEKPKKVFFEGEDKDEEILYIFREASIKNLGWIFSFFVLLLLPIFFNFILLQFNQSDFPMKVNMGTSFILNVFWYLFTFGFGFERFLSWFFNVYIITSKRIVDMDFTGLFHKNVSEAPLRNIEDITYTVSGTFPTLFNYGTIRIQTAAEKGEFEFTDVSSPSKVQDILSDLVSKIKGYYDNN